MTRKNKRMRYNPIHICLLKGVPTSWKLSEVIEGIKSRLKSLVFAHRITDCEKKIISNEVFIGLHDVTQYLALKEMQRISIREVECEIDFIEFVNSSATRAINQNQNNLPTVMCIQPLKIVFALTSIYLQALVEELEQAGTVIGFSLNYDNREKRSRTFGFASFFPDATTEELANKTFTVDLLPIHLKEASSVPVVVSGANRSLIEGKNLIYEGDIPMANWLFTQLEDIEPAEEEEREAVEREVESDNESILSIENEIDLENL
ncbi:hypothetical protein PVAND_014466 [Polypedilum vanderplanki]|uniref:Uncharacterized protein n=1 Tax=Polypedilum vanderplanki TaxID=319348 RepID=A0A9J6B9Z5_POLVA|nr:hypothetical protein PVAND_014466 [Polypedilum vanderplanki]